MLNESWKKILYQSSFWKNLTALVEKFIHKYWEYIEDRAISMGEENEE
jgi:hypothetical protein